MAISYRDLALPLMLETGALSADIQKTMLGFASGEIFHYEAVFILSRAQPQCANIAGQVKNIRPGYSELKKRINILLRVLHYFVRASINLSEAWSSQIHKNLEMAQQPYELQRKICKFMGKKLIGFS